jgi:hypothetical protein
VFFCLLGAALLGALLRSHLPETHLSPDSKDAIKLATAIVATLSAISLGFLTASAKTAFDHAEADLRMSVAHVVLLDREMAHYGPQTQDARDLLRKFIEAQLYRTNSDTSDLAIEMVQDQLRSLAPETAAQRLLQTRALEVSGKIAETHWLLVETGSEELPGPFMIILVLWLVLLFVTFGLLAPRNATVTCTLVICALSVAGAVFLIVDMAHPYLGIIHISDASLRTALEQLGKS